MAISYQVFSDVSDVELAGAAVSGVQSIAVIRRGAEIRAAGDEDVYESVARAGPAGLSGTIELADIAQAEALGDAAGTLTFVWRNARGQTDRTVTVAGVSITGVELSAGHQQASKASVSFVAESADGVTDPIAVT